MLAGVVCGRGGVLQLFCGGGRVLSMVGWWRGNFLRANLGFNVMLLVAGHGVQAGHGGQRLLVLQVV